MLFVKKKHPPVDTHAAQGTGEVERQRRGPYRGALFNISPSSCSCCRRAASLSNSWVPTSPVPLGIVTKLPQPAAATNAERPPASLHLSEWGLSPPSNRSSGTSSTPSFRRRSLQLLLSFPSFNRSV